MSAIIASLEDLRAAVSAVVEYNWRDELNDYVDHDGEPGHIFEALAALEAWLSGNALTARDHLGYVLEARRRVEP